MTIRNALIAAAGATLLFGGFSTAIADTPAPMTSKAAAVTSARPTNDHKRLDHKRLVERRHLRNERRLAMKKHGVKTARLAQRKSNTHREAPVAKAG
jgi:hypothetical protein